MAKCIQCKRPITSAVSIRSGLGETHRHNRFDLSGITKALRNAGYTVKRWGMGRYGSNGTYRHQVI